MACLPVLLFFSGKTCAQATDPSVYPRFSWDKVPVAAFVGKTAEPLTEQEMKFLASHFPIVFLSNAHNMRKMETTEAGIAADAARLKQTDPSLKVFFYWNSFIDYATNYAASKTFALHDEWALRDTKGEYIRVRDKWKRYDHSQPGLREWWSDVAAHALKDPNLDGVFIDAIPQLAARPEGNAKIWGREKQAALEQGIVQSLRLLGEKTAHKKLLIFNGLRGTPGLWPDGGMSYLDYTHGAIVEHFPGFENPAKENIARDFELITEAGKKGKIVIVKGWPQFSWLDSAIMKKPQQEIEALARQQLLFPLACYLIAAQPYSYLCYSWGYRENHGTFSWYDEFDKPLGKPLADYTRNGWVFTRYFEHASVTVDLDRRAAVIDWKR